MKPVTPEHPEIILASGSPRRKELIERIGFEPVVRVSSIPEERHSGESPSDYALRLAGEKARHVAAELEEDDQFPGWILSADTIVVHHDEVLEKPDDEDHAIEMLQRLSGQQHEVITSYCWLWRDPTGEGTGGFARAGWVSTDVWLRELDDEMIERYVATGEPMDKAGSYGIQKLGGVLVRRLEGSYFCVMGLPVCEVVEVLQQLGGLEAYPFGKQ